MPGRLQDRIAVVTGSNSGIGRGTAMAYARKGAIVVCASRQVESKYPAEADIATHDLITRNGGKAIYKQLQFTQTDSINALVKDVVSEYGRIDVWVNNAGTAGTVAFYWNMTDEDFDTTVDTNLKGTFRCIKAAAGQMMSQEPLSNGNRGSIINISSILALRGFMTSIAYAPTKAGITSLSRVSAGELAYSKITVNTITPGPVRTAMMDGLPEPVQEAVRAGALLGFGQPSDLAGAAILFASDEGRWISGADLVIDGAYTTT